MFAEANKLASQRQADLLDTLDREVDALDKTATNWFDDTSESVTKRQSKLMHVANLLNRAAQFDPIDGAEFQSLAHEFVRQATELNEAKQYLVAAEYEQRVGTALPVFSALGDESKLSARRDDTDWDMFMAVEPREFVASNTSALNDKEEMQFRALSFMEDTTSGYGFNRTAKKSLAAEFLARVEVERVEAQKNVHTPHTATAEVFEDSDLFF